MLRLVLLLITLVTIASAGEGYKKKLFKKYAMTNMFAKCIGEEAMDKFYVDWINAAMKCNGRDWDPKLKPVYIRPYPSSNEIEKKPYKSYNKQNYYQQPNMGYNNQPYYNQPPMPPMYQQPNQYQQPQMYRQPPMYQQQNPSNQLYSRQKREDHEAGDHSVTAELGEAELYYYNKLKKMMHHKVGNFSCMMHEMGYLTEENEVNIEKYHEFYNELTTIPEAMKKDFHEIVDLCHEVSQCMPEKCFAKYPYGKEYGRAFFFSMCEKKKALEVCLKKQMVDDYYKYKDMFKFSKEDLSEMEDMEDTDDLFTMGF